MSDMLFTCGSLMSDFRSSEKGSEVMEKVFVRANHDCSTPVEVLYYTLNYEECCCHCGSKQRLIKTTNEYPICTPCKVIRKKTAVMKRKRKVLDPEKL